MNNTLENKKWVKGKIHAAILAIMFGLMSIFTTISEAKSMNEKQTLSDRQKSIVTIAAFTASGDLKELKTSLNEGLDSGLTVNEIKEILVQMYAYAGFPRSLNGITTFMEVLDKRQAKGIKDEIGKGASPVPADFDKDEYGAKVRAKLAGRDDLPPPSGWQLFVPVIDTFLKEHLFADIFVRDVLSHQGRELATIAALANMTGTEGQLRFHFGAAINTGLTETQMKDFISILNDKIDKKNAENAEEVLNTVLNSRK
jgi:4-carboxymuconolactone decarboxylase